MDVLRTAVSALAAFDPDVADNSPQAIVRKGVRLTSQVPMIVAAHEHIRNGRAPVAPDPTLGHAANFLYMLKGTSAERGRRAADGHRHDPARRARRERVVVHRARRGGHGGQPARRDHGGDRRAVGPGARRRRRERDAHGAGDRRAANAADYVKAKRANKEPVMGFGHRVYRAEDPRARHMRAGVEKLSREMGEPKWYQILEALVEAMKPYARHGVNVNVDFYAGVVYYLNGIPDDLFVPIFAIGRVPGWTVQVLEQMENNILIRPLTLYNGPRAARVRPA